MADELSEEDHTKNLCFPHLDQTSTEESDFMTFKLRFVLFSTLTKHGSLHFIYGIMCTNRERSCAR